MKIAVCGLKTVPSDRGGIERGAEELNSRLAAEGIAITLYCRDDRPGRFTHRGMVVERVPGWHHKYFGYFSYMTRVAWRLIRHRPRFDIVHVHTPCINGLWILLFRLLGYRTLAHSHGLEWRASKWPYWFRCLMRFLEHVGSIGAHVVVCVSSEEADHFRKRLPASRVVHIQNGIPEIPAVESSETMHRLGLKRGEYYLFVGRIVPQKCPVELAEAFLASKSRKKLVIAGGSSFTDGYQDKLRQLCKDKERVILPGWVSRKEVEALLRDCFAFVLPSKHEGCPNALLEAIGFGCVCLVSDIPAHRELVGDAQPVIEVADAQEFSAALAELESSPQLHRQYKLATVHIAKGLLTWEAIASRFQKVYGGLTAKLPEMPVRR